MGWTGSAARVVRAAVLAAALVAAPRPAAAEGDDGLLKAYALTMDKVREYAAATKALEKTMASDKALEAEVDRMDSEPQGTVAEMKAKLGRHPAVLALYQHEGLSLDDCVLLPLVAINALNAVEAPPDQVDLGAISVEQIGFAKRHKRDLEAVITPAGGAED